MAIGRLSNEAELARFVEGLAPANGSAPLVSSLPSGRHGDEIRYKHSQGYWSFRYDAEDSYWYLVGGGPLYTNVVTDQATTGTHTTYQSLATPLTITNPLAGDYMLAFGAAMYCTGAANGLMSSPEFGAADTPDNNDRAFAQTSAVAQVLNASRSIRRDAIPVSTAITLQHAATVNSASNFFDRWMSVTPIRVQA